MRPKMKVFTAGLALILTVGTFAACSGPADAALAQEVTAKLKADAMLAPRAITVTAVGHDVTLSGSVNSEAEKSAAEQIAKGVKGVKTVVNNLAVKSAVVNATPPPVSPDMTLKADVAASLAKYGITGVSVEVANGEVTLTGDIQRAKLQDAMKAANESHPKKVVNKMNIK